MVLIPTARIAAVMAEQALTAPVVIAGMFKKIRGNVQSRTFQAKILQGASQEGYVGLYWYVEARLPYSMRSSPDKGEVFVCYPHRRIPVVPVAPDPAKTRPLAAMMGELYRPHAPSNELSVSLIHEDTLKGDNLPWYVWTDPVLLDVICACCGEVAQIDHALVEDDWICKRCRMGKDE